MIEKVILDYLNEKLSVPAYMEMPERLPGAFVVIEKTGSGKENHICSAMFAIQSYGESMLKAAELNEEVKSVMEDIVKLEEVSRAELNSDYHYSDTTRKRYRYQAVYGLVYF